LLFNSFLFALFLPVVFALHWALPRRRWQNGVLMVASYVFYGWWDWRFLSLILASSLLDFMLGQHMQRASSPKRKRRLLTISLLANLGTLGIFKYFNFFAGSFVDVAHSVGLDVGTLTIDVILPVGISFYTFQTLSYTLDLYKGRMQAHDSLLDFLTFVAFFPQLVAGPIERAANLLDQFEQPRTFDAVLAHDGARQMLWGFTKKILIADRVAPFVDATYAQATTADGATLAVATFFFSVQIYADFSGYSDIAIGCAKLFNIKLMRNFATPYFSTSIAEFWKRWHISLSTWFGDYVYIALGGNRCGKGMQLRNIFIVFLVSGLWHGANWTFVAWGAVHALLYIPVVMTPTKRNQDIVPGGEGLLPSVADGARMFALFTIVTLAWVFFRADSIAHAVDVFTGMFTRFSVAGLLAAPKGVLALLGAFFVVDWLGRARHHAFDVAHWPRPARWMLYWAVGALLLQFAPFGEAAFIYFQF